MSIEERLARDIAEVSRGVVVTDSDLRDARTAIDDRIGSGRQQDRRRSAFAAAAAAAVVVLLLGLAAYLTIGGEDKAAPPAGPGPSPSPGIDNHADFLSGSAPTSESIRGVWRLDDGGLLMRFAPPDLVSWDRDGRLFEDPSVQGRYAIDGDRISITVDGGPAGCGGQQMAMRGSLPEQGALHLVYTRSGTGACNTVEDERWVMEQVLPASPTMAALDNSAERSWSPLPGESRLYGTWMAEGGGHLLELDPIGEYHVAAGTGEQVDYGEWALQGSKLTLTSWPDSVECSSGDRLVLGGVEVGDFGTPLLRGTVRENTCGAAWTPDRWVLIPYEGS